MIIGVAAGFSLAQVGCHYKVLRKTRTGIPDRSTVFEKNGEYFYLFGSRRNNPPQKASAHPRPQ